MVSCLRSHTQKRAFLNQYHNNFLQQNRELNILAHNTIHESEMETGRSDQKGQFHAFENHLIQMISKSLKLTFNLLTCLTGYQSSL